MGQSRKGSDSRVHHKLIKCELVSTNVANSPFKILYLVDVTAATEADIRRLYCDYKAKRMVSNTTQIRCGILIMIDYYYSHGQRFCSAFGLGRVFQVSFRLFFTCLYDIVI